MTGLQLTRRQYYALCTMVLLSPLLHLVPRKNDRGGRLLRLAVRAGGADAAAAVRVDARGHSAPRAAGRGHRRDHAARARAGRGARAAGRLRAVVSALQCVCAAHRGRAVHRGSVPAEPAVAVRGDDLGHGGLRCARAHEGAFPRLRDLSAAADARAGAGAGICGAGAEREKSAARDGAGAPRRCAQRADGVRHRGGGAVFRRVHRRAHPPAPAGGARPCGGACASACS